MIIAEAKMIPAELKVTSGQAKPYVGVVIVQDKTELRVAQDALASWTVDMAITREKRIASVLRTWSALLVNLQEYMSIH